MFIATIMIIVKGPTTMFALQFILCDNSNARIVIKIGISIMTHPNNINISMTTTPSIGPGIICSSMPGRINSWLSRAKKFRIMKFHRTDKRIRGLVFWYVFSNLVF